MIADLAVLSAVAIVCMAVCGFIRLMGWTAWLVEALEGRDE